MVTLTFLSALALAVSVFTKYGKWLALTTSLLSIIAFVSLPSDSIQQTGGMVLVISFTIGIHLQFNIYNGANQNVVNGLGGVAICLLLLNLYPVSGLVESAFEYTSESNFKQLIYSISYGIIISQMLVNVNKFSEYMTVFSLLLYGAVWLFSGVEYSEPLFVITTSSIIFGILPYFETIISQKIGSGQGRSVSLGVSTLIGIILILVFTYFSVSNVERIGDDSGAIAVSLWLTLAITIIGIFGMLLPLMGFDAHPRPEAWGWRLCLSLSPMILTFQTDLASEIILGVIFAILISITSPLVMEKRHKKLAN